MLKKTIFLFVIGFLFSNCGSSFSSNDKKIIYNNPNKAARVLNINNPKDSIILRTKSTDIKKIDNNKDLLALIEKLKITMEKEQGVGIAAPQIGINKNIFLFLRMDRENNPIQVAINPIIFSKSEEKTCFLFDGCLSVPDKYGNSERSQRISVEYLNEKGEMIIEGLEGESRLGDYTGIIFQHEYDHLQGNLYIDKLCEK